MREPHTTKARDWNDARLRGERLPEHELPDLRCEYCAEPCSEADHIEAIDQFICTCCLEAMTCAQVTA